MTRLSPAVAVIACLLAFAPAAQAQDDTWIRKDVKDLSAQEKKNFVNAIMKIKHTRSPYGKRKISYYDFLVYYHRRASNGKVNGAHRGPAFLPWHREFLNAFESLLTNISKKHIEVPYWDWTNPASTQAMLDMMGGNGDPEQKYAITKGPFRKGNWKIVLRDVPGRKNPLQPDIDDAVDQALHPARAGRRTRSPPRSRRPRTPRPSWASARYDAKPWNDSTPAKRSFRCAIEGWSSLDQEAPVGGHNQVHVWVAGRSARSAVRRSARSPTPPPRTTPSSGCSTPTPTASGPSGSRRTAGATTCPSTAPRAHTTS